MSIQQKTNIVHGRGVSPGLAQGVTFLHRDLFKSPDKPVPIHLKDVEQEIGHLESSTAKITNDLLTLATRVESEMDSRLAAVFDAHQLMLNDAGLKNELQAEIQGKLVNASTAVKAVFLRWENRFLMMESQTGQHKGADMRDISNRLSNALDGVISPPLGAMIETPAAALSLKGIAPHVDFVSFGTNDLTQYTFAADRENAAVEPYFNDSDDAIFRLLQIALADAPQLPAAICGKLAGRATHIPRLLQGGIRTVSVVPPLIPAIKAAIRAVRIE